MTFIPWTKRELQQNGDGTFYDPNLKDWERCPKCGQCEDISADEDLYNCPDCQINWTKDQWPNWSEWDFWNCPEGNEHLFPPPM